MPFQSELTDVSRYEYERNLWKYWIKSQCDNTKEEPLPAGGSCLLGSINLAEFVNENGEFDSDGFIRAVSIATRALNEVLDEGIPMHPLAEQRESVSKWRQIGLGIMGLADMLIKMKVRYGSHESLVICNMIGKLMINAAAIESCNLAREKGRTFDGFDFDKLQRSMFAINNFTPSTMSYIAENGMMNSQLLTCAPTGTLSTMLGISGGIEPIYDYGYERKTESLHGEDVYYKVYTPIVAKYMEEHDISDESELPDYFVTAKELDYHARINMQATWQRYIDASISSTVNLPFTATPEEILDIYLTAWESGLKGITVFRDGCKRAGVLTTDNHEERDSSDITAEQHSKSARDLPRGYILDASEGAIGKKRKLITGCGSLHCLAYFDPDTGDLLETYLSKGSTGGCNNYMIGLSRMISLAARSGCNIQSIVDQLNSCGVCPSYAVRRATKHDTSDGSCCPVAIGNALLSMYEEMQEELIDTQEGSSEVSSCELENVLAIKKPTKHTEKTQTQSDQPPKYICPSCGSTIAFEGGCNGCKNCGWSPCN